MSAKTVLVVEDEQSLQDVYVQILKGAGYSVVAAGDGKTAFETLKGQSFQLVLLDIMLPEMDGLQVLEKAVKEAGLDTSATVVIMLTNLPQDNLVAKAITLGARGYLVKSDYTPDQLLNEINGYLG